MTVVFRDGYQVTAQELSRLAAMNDGSYTFDSTAGGAVTPNANMTINIAAITGNLIVANSVRGSTNYAGGTVTFGTAHASLPRRDHVWFQVSDGTVGITAGTAATYPLVPDLSAGRISLAVATIAANDTVIGAGDLDDRRPFANSGVFDAIRTLFRGGTPRKLLGEFATMGWNGTYDDMGNPAGLLPLSPGFSTYMTSATYTYGNPVTLLLESYTQLIAAQAVSNFIGSFQSGGTVLGVTAPNKNPRMLLRWIPGSSHANDTVTMAGFVQVGSAAAAAAAGAFLRATTTGNLFFVTDQGGSETTTDLGARPTALTSYEIYTEDAGVTWVCRNTTTGTVVATHTTNVPTATVALGIVIGGIAASTGVTHVGGVSYCRVEGNNVA